MKTRILFSTVVLFGLLPVKADDISHASVSVIDRTLHSAVMEHVRSIEKDGKQQSITNRYTTLATGLHRMVNGELVEADPVIELQEGGAIADKTQHKVKFTANINDWEGAIEVVATDETRFLSRPLGISYYDTATEQSVLIAELKDSTGLLFAPNKIVYPDAFTDFEADLEYNNMLAGLQQNLIFRECPPAPEKFGLNNETTVIELLTEFFESPVPVKKTELRNDVADDRQLDFGAMKIGVGKSFMVGEESRSYSVQKQWTQLEGRNFLIERVPYPKISGLLNTLPATAQANNFKPDKMRHIALKKRLLPERQVAKINRNSEIQVASAALGQKGFVIDYSLLTGSLTNFVFQGDTTYLITNVVSFSTNTIFEGGTVVKFVNGAKTTLEEIEFKTDAYLPAVFTSMHDDSVGETIGGSSGNPWTNYCGDGLHLTGGDNTLRYARFAFLETALTFESGPNPLNIQHVGNLQFVRCNIAIEVVTWEDNDGDTINIDNALFYSIGKLLEGNGVLETKLNAQHITVHQCNVLNSAKDSYIALTNSLLVAVTNFTDTSMYPVSSNQVVTLANGSGIFQTVGAGAHYLAEASPYRNAGTTNISAEALSAIKTKTTYPPVVLPTLITNDLTLKPIAQRDTDSPDLGYHYSPLDFVFGDARISGATLNLRNGVAVGFYRTQSPAFGACMLQCGATLESIGSPSNLNHLVWYNTVQEQANTNWIAADWFLDIIGMDTYDCGPVEVTCRFTEFTRLADGWGFIGGGDIGWEAQINLQDCQFYGGFMGLGGVSGDIAEYHWKIFNCLLFRCPIWIQFAWERDLRIDFENNLFYGGSVSIYGYEDHILSITFTNNFFFTNDFTIYYPVDLTHGYNAYIEDYPFLDYYVSEDVVLSSVPEFNKGPLGEFCLPGNSPLINAGSTNAHLLGLYHFTTTTNQVKETNSMVDIGFHYVAVNLSTGLPLDWDGEGLADYFEDKNGNGTHDTGETDWEDDDTDGDDLNDYFEWKIGSNPQNPAGIESDTNGVVKLRVHTRLK